VKAEMLPQGELRFAVSSCQYARFFQEIGEPDLGFLLVCSADGPIAQGFGIGFERSQILMQGGSHGDLRYILRPPGIPHSIREGLPRRHF
jgi:hypothetical protein